MEVVLVNGERKHFPFTQVEELALPSQGQIIPPRRATSRCVVDIKDAQMLFELPCAHHHKSVRLPMYVTLTCILPIDPAVRASATIKVTGEAINQLVWFKKDMTVRVSIQFRSFGEALLQTTMMNPQKDADDIPFYEQTVTSPSADYFFQGRRYTGNVIITVGANENEDDVEMLSQEVPRRILEKEDLTDFILVASNGVNMRCLKAFLAVKCDFFNRLFNADCSEKISGTCQTQLSETALRAFLEYVYCDVVDRNNTSVETALELLEAGHMYLFSTLETTIKALLLAKPVDWFTLDSALWLFDFASKVQGYEELSGKAIEAVKAHRSQLETPEWQEKLESSPQFSKELIISLSKML